MKDYSFMEVRVKNKIPAEEMSAKVQHILTTDDVNILLTNPTIVQKPDGRLLAKYLPAAFTRQRMAEFYDVLHDLRKMETTNRGYASGTEAHPRFGGSTRVESAPIRSAIIGSFDAVPPKLYCRLTAWSGKELDKYASLFPLFQDIGAYFESHVADRFAAQMAYVRKTDPDWIIEGTPFTTITVNNSYPTGVHQDQGDLDQGFSTLTVLRRGNYSGGWITFPEYRIAVDMQDGDLLLMDAHEWHGNVAMTCGDCGLPMGAGVLPKFRNSAPEEWDRMAHEKRSCTAERISVVAYYRTRMAECGTAEEEAKRSVEWGERRAAIGAAAVEAMALETGG